MTRQPPSHCPSLFPRNLFRLLSLGFVSVTLIFLILTSSTAGQQDNPNTRREIPSPGKVSNILQNIPDTPAPDTAPAVDPEVAQKHNAWKLEFERRIYEWQFTTSKLVFFMVILMVLAGLYFSWMHFEASLRPRRTIRKKSSDAAAPAEPPAPLPGPEVTQFEGYGLKISTPILGVVILAFSFIFFYAYLQFVYPIK